MPNRISQNWVQQIAPAVDENILSVVDLLSHKDNYLGREILVRGKVAIMPLYSVRPCPTGGLGCDTIMGLQLELWDAQSAPGTETKIFIFRTVDLIHARNLVHRNTDVVHM
jgi:hypothetical protein